MVLLSQNGIVLSSALTHGAARERAVVLSS